VFTVKPRLRKINDRRITVNLIVDKADSEDRRDYLIREISKEKGIFPLSRFDMGNLPVKVIQEFEKFPTKWKISNTGGDSETLYEHKAGFYIYTKKGQQLSDVSLFYETIQHNEVQFFINRLMKLLE
jgi:hypothetical protein